MTAKTLYVAFAESDELREAMDRFLSAVAADPEGDHVDLLRQVIDHFVEELVAAFFDGPVDATGARGGMVRVIQSVANVVRKTAVSMAGRLVSKVEAGQSQQAMAAHLQSHRMERDGRTYAVYPLDAAMAERASLTFEETLAGNRDAEHLITVMKGIAEGALEHYLDRTVEPIELGRFSRGMVSTARATIRKAAYTGIEKGLPGLPTKLRDRVVGYFQGMLLEA